MLLGVGAFGSTASEPGAGVDSEGKTPSGVGVVSPGMVLVESGLPGISLVVGTTSEGVGLSVVDDGVAVEGAEASVAARSGVFFVQATLRAKAAEAKRIFFM